MKCFLRICVLFISCTFTSQAEDSVGESEIFAIWPTDSPKIKTGIPEKAKSKNDLYYHIFNPTLEVIRPEKSNGAAIIIFPGGGYSIVCANREGRRVGRNFAESGLTCFVLKYRLPNTKGAKFERLASFADAQRAIKYVRHHAKKWDLDPQRIGVMGFSAGGHLASMTGTLFDKPLDTDGEINEVNCRPDFMLLIYPVINSYTKGVMHSCVKKLLPEAEIKSISSELNVSKETSPTFLVHSKPDGAVPFANSVLMYEALKKHQVAAELKLYEQGSHGFGLGKKHQDSSAWPEDCISWLKAMKFIP